MAWTNSGYDGTVDESAWARMARQIGTDYDVLADTHFKPTVAVADRTVAVAAGTAYAFGVVSISDTTVNVQCATITSGSRWDTIAIRRNWTGSGGTTSLVAITGTAQKLVTKTYSTPGVQDDQPIALARLQGGSTAVQELVDLRTAASKVITATDLLALPAARWGTEAKVGNIRYRRELDGSSNLAWIKDSSILGGTTATEYTASQVIVSEPGWAAGGTGVLTRGIVIGNWVQLDIQMRTSDDLNPNIDTKIATIVPLLCPDTTVLVNALYYNSGRGTFGGLMTINPDGELYTRSGYPDQPIAATAAGTVGLRANALYMRKVA